MIEWKCWRCEHEVSVSADLAGTCHKCPQCGAKLTAPMSSADREARAQVARKQERIRRVKSDAMRTTRALVVALGVISIVYGLFVLLRDPRTARCICGHTFPPMATYAGEPPDVEDDPDVDDDPDEDEDNTGDEDDDEISAVCPECGHELTVSKFHGYGAIVVSLVFLLFGAILLLYPRLRSCLARE